MDGCEVLASWSKEPQKIAREAFLDLQTNPPFSNRTLTRETYSCNICGHCRSVCPVDIDMGDVFRMSRAARRDSGKYPDAFHEFWLRDMDFIAHHAGCAIPPDEGLAAEQGGYVFFPGCKLGGYTPSRVMSSARFLRERYGAGIVLDCCGAPAYWAGEDARHRAHIDVLRGVWQSMDKPAFVFACAYCEMVFERFLPEIERVSLYALLADADAGAGSADNVRNAPVGKSGGGSAEPQKSDAVRSAKYSVFDPCASPPNGAAAESVRRLARECGAELHELPEQGRCCGFGGHMRAANPPLYDAMTKNRAEMGEQPYIVYCANCEDVFKRRGKDCIHAIDLLFGTPAESGGGIPDLQTQRDRLVGLKSDLENSYKGSIGSTGGAGDVGKTEYNGEIFVSHSEPWDGVNVVIGDGLLRQMDEDLIMKSDVKEAVWAAESRKDFFYRATGGIRQCCLVKPPITYWVQYRPMEKDTYEVVQAYSHRMCFDADM
jgi:Fe-S oxidoreductase